MANLEIFQTERGSTKGSDSGLQTAVGQLDRTELRRVAGKSRIGNVEAAFAKPGGFSMVRSNMMHSGQSRPPGLPLR